MKPLEGVKVVELARVLAGPWCGQLLADLGAEVIKIERPSSGDDTRQWGPPFVYDGNGRSLDSAYFHSANRGKRSIFVDLDSKDGQEQVHELASEADVLIENYKVGGLTKYGLDPRSLRVLHPKLIVCSITGFGQTGPYAHRPGYDFIIQAMGGFMSLTGEPDGPPQKAGLAYADLLTGVYSAVAILAALQRKAKIGIGSHIDMALLDTQVSVLANQAQNWFASGEVPNRMGNGHANLVPYQAFKTNDGELVIAVGNNSQFQKLCSVLGLNDDFVKEFSNNEVRVLKRENLIRILSESISQWPTDELSERLEAVGVPAGPINNIEAVFSDPHIRRRGIVVEVGGRPSIASPIVIDGERMFSELPPPGRGSSS